MKSSPMIVPACVMLDTTLLFIVLAFRALLMRMTKAITNQVSSNLQK